MCSHTYPVSAVTHDGAHRTGLRELGTERPPDEAYTTEDEFCDGFNARGSGRILQGQGTRAHDQQDDGGWTTGWPHDVGVRSRRGRAAIPPPPLRHAMDRERGGYQQRFASPIVQWEKGRPAGERETPGTHAPPRPGASVDRGGPPSHARPHPGAPKGQTRLDQRHVLRRVVHRRHRVHRRDQTPHRPRLLPPPGVPTRGGRRRPVRARRHLLRRHRGP